MQSITPASRGLRLGFVAVAAIFGAGTNHPADAQTAPRPAAAPFGDLAYRMVGPARGGRVTTVTGVPSQPSTFYMGVASGGVWRTTDDGASWVPISDGKIPIPSIGSIDVAASDPNVIYVGTGSDDIRSNVSTGRGVYKSVDAGKTWSFAGLRDAGQIGAVRISPTDPNVAYVAAIGNAFKPNTERGVFRTRDGGNTWTKVLFISDSTGSADIELQPGNPNVIYASMWRGERRPWTIISGAHEGGLYRSADGGDHWTKLTNGLPHDLFGKSNIAVTAANPNRVYALIEAKPGGGLYRSDDAGEHWAIVSANPQLITRPFYYVTLAADPTNADVVYGGAEGFFKSIDGGKTFRTMRVPHGDNHDMWISPKDGNVMIEANDGGANVSLDGGRTWSTQYNQPTAEIYAVALDDQFPYRIYGAQQDNTTLIVPSLPLNTGQADEWRTGPGCETGPIIPHITNPDTVYASCKGQFSRMSLRTGEEKQYWVGAQSLYGNPARDLIYRFQRVSPMDVSPHDPHVVYYGSQYLHRTRDEGVTWEKMSPDLTAHDPRYQGSSGEPITRDVTGEEFYSTLYAIRESPLEKGLIWTGANDGPVYVTRDDGKTWKNVTPKGLPPGGRVQNIEPSPHRAGSAYIAVYRYLLGDFRPYIYRTDNYGSTWTLLTNGANGIPNDYPTRVVREDPDRAGLLYAGTEFGMFVSFDNGGHWQPFQLNLPATPITDIRVHQKNLVISTQGRSFWILDDLTPLQQWSDSVAASSAHLFTPRAAYRMRYAVSRGGGDPATPQYPRPGAMIDYYLASIPAGAVTLDIVDATGKVVRSFSSESSRAVSRPEAANAAEESEEGPSRAQGMAIVLPKHQGMNRFIWDLRYPGPWQAATRSAGNGGPMAVPGSYSVRLTVAGANGATALTETRPLDLRIDPRVAQDGVSPADLRGQLEHNVRVRDLVSDANRAVAAVRAVRIRLKGVSGPGADTLAAVSAIEASLVTPPIRYSKPGLQSHITYLYGMTTDADQAVGHDALERYNI
ncbi:MAG: WD40/YVTN/BNR-like repeat-containing protein, partial [Gemmatimonadaceae bacterium]